MPLYSRSRVPRSKPRRTTKRRTTARRPLAARQQVSRRKYFTNKSLARSVAQVAETKYITMNSPDDLAPTLTTATDTARVFFRTGQPITGETDMTQLAGFECGWGNTPQDRNGDYIYLKKSHVSFQLDTIAAERVIPMEYRFIMFKRRRNNNVVANLPNVQTELFVDTSGKSVGESTAGLRAQDIFLLPVNKKSFVVYKDYKFRLSNAHEEGAVDGSQTSCYYPTTRTIVCDCPHWKKTHYDNATRNPDDYDANWYFVIYARPIGYGGAQPIHWEVSSRGITTFNDM